MPNGRSRSAPLAEPLLDRLEAARLLKISPARLGSPAWRRRFGLPVLRVGGQLRFAPESLRAWLAEHAERATVQ